MARMSGEEIEEIIQREVPGARIKKRPALEEATAEDALRPQPDVGTPDLADLRRQYRGRRLDLDSPPRHRAAAAAPAAGAEDDEGAPEDEFVEIDMGDDTPAKTVLISGKDKKIIAEQG